MKRLSIHLPITKTNTNNKPPLPVSHLRHLSPSTHRILRSSKGISITIRPKHERVSCNNATQTLYSTSRHKLSATSILPYYISRFFHLTLPTAIELLCLFRAAYREPMPKQSNDHLKQYHEPFVHTDIFSPYSISASNRFMRELLCVLFPL